MIPVRYQAHGTTSPALLRRGGRRTQCPPGGRTPVSVTAPLSRQIHDLEDEVRTKPFVRSKSGMRLPPVNQGTVGSEDDRNFSTQRNFLEGGTINQTGKKNSNSATTAVYTATYAMNGALIAKRINSERPASSLTMVNT